MRAKNRRIAGWLATAGLIGAALILPVAALATQPAPTHKVTICHATNSDTNPYVLETVDIASSGHLRAGHDDHTGPLWSATLKAAHTSWGDIIPPYAYKGFSYAGLNWTAGGRAILAAGCRVLTPTTTATATPTATPVSTWTPTATPNLPEVTPTTTPTGSVEGETGTPTPTNPGSTATPSGSVEGETGTAGSPPPTDASGLVDSATSPGIALILLAAVLFGALAGRPSRARRR
jgi:hypothetical protein